MKKKANNTKEVIVEGVETPSAGTLHPGAAPSDGGSYDPTRSELMAAIVAAAGGIEKGDLSKFLDSINAIGHEGDQVDDGSAEKNKASISAKPSDAVKEDLATIFVGEELSEQFIEKAATLFEAAVNTKVAVVKAQLEDDFESNLEKAYGQLEEQLTTQVDDYLNYVVESWVQDNQLAIDEGIKTDITESFIEGMKNLFKEHYIDIPEDKVDVVDQLAQKVEELQKKLDEQISENIKNKKEVDDVQKQSLITVASEGLTATQADKFKQLCENVEFTGDEDLYNKQLKIVRENYFKNNKPTSSGIISEDIAVEEGSEMVPDPDSKSRGPMDVYVNALSRTLKR